MKVSSRGGGLSGCRVWGPCAAPPPCRAAAACGRRRPNRRRAGLAPREGARWRGRRAASGPAWPGYLGAREEPPRSCGQAGPERS